MSLRHVRHYHCSHSRFSGIKAFLDRRAQYLFAGSTVPSAPAANEGVCSEEDEDEESRFRPFNEQDERYFDSNDEAENFAPHDGFVNQLEWDEDLEVSDSMAIRTDERQTSQASSSLPAMKRMAQNMSERQDAVTPLPSFPASLGVRWDTPPPRETTPLLARKVSISFDVPKQPPRRMSLSAKYGEHGHHLDANLPCSIAQRRLSNVSVARSTRSIRSIKHMGQSTFGQTVRLLQIQRPRISSSRGHFIALQLHRHSSWHWNALGAVGFRLLGLVHGNGSHNNLRRLGLLHVGWCSAPTILCSSYV